MLANFAVALEVVIAGVEAGTVDVGDIRGLGLGWDEQQERVERDRGVRHAALVLAER